MKKLLILLIVLLMPLGASADLYVAEVVMETYTDDLGEVWTAGTVISKFTVPDGTTINAPLFEITETEYNTGSIAQAKIDTALAEAPENEKDFEVKFDKLLKAFALVVLDEINLLRAEAGLSARTTQQLKTAVGNRYDTL